MLGMVAPYEGWRPPANPAKVNGWSGHWTDIHLAVAEGLKLNVAELRQALGDEDVFLQEYCCIPMADGSEYITLAQILACESQEASAEWDGKPRAGLCAGFDVRRTRDLSVIAIGEPVGPLAIVRGLILMPRMRFEDQKKICRDVAKVVEECGGRFAMDATGIGTQLGEELSGEFTCVEPVNFASAVETEAKTEDGKPIKEPVKLRLGGLLKRRFEEQMIWIPEMPALRRSIQAVKRFIGSTGAVRLDAVRTDQGHADEFWALALMCGAMEGPRRSYQPASDEDLVGDTVVGNVMEAVF
jgi:phage FluMu gp28-like protein